MHKKEDYLDQEITNFQDYVDSHVQDWWTLRGEVGLSKWIHIPVFGNATKNVDNSHSSDIFSQQGWYNLNSILKSFFFRRTNHGGTKNWTKLKVIGR